MEGVLSLFIKHDRRGPGFSDQDRKQIASTHTSKDLVCHQSKLSVQFLDFPSRSINCVDNYLERSGS